MPSPRSYKAAVVTLTALYLLPFLSAFFFDVRGSGVMVATVDGALVAIALCVVMWRLMGTLPVPRIGRAEILLFVLLLVVSFMLLRPDRYGGFPGMAGGDGGLNALRARMHFTDGIRLGDYRGQTALFMVSSWWATLGIEFPHAINLPLWLAMLLGPALAISAASRADPTSARGDLVLRFVVASGCLGIAVLPILFYAYADGFWPQVSGLIPLVVTIVGYALLGSPLARLLLLAFGAFSLRYAYALNLGDLCVAIAACCVIELLRGDLGDWARRLAALLVIASVTVAFLTYQELVGLLGIPGGFHPYPERPWITAQLLMVLGLGGCAVLTREGALRRLATASAIVLLCSGTFMAWFFAGDRQPEYYFYKYALAPTILGGVASAVVGAWLIREIWSQRHRTRQLLAVGASTALVGGYVALASGATEYREILLENAGLAPQLRLHQIYHPETIGAIEEVMRRHPDTPFAVLASYDWPESSLSNAAIWRSESGRINDGLVDPGLAHAGLMISDARPSLARCLFWYDLALHRADYLAGTRELLEELSRFATCDAGEPHLCHACLYARTRHIPLQPWLDLAHAAERPPFERELRLRAGEVCVLRLPPAVLEANGVSWNGEPLRPLNYMAAHYIRLPTQADDGRGTLRVAWPGRGPIGGDNEATLHCFADEPTRTAGESRP